MHVTAKADYAVRAAVELATGSQDAPRKVDQVAQAQDIPVSFWRTSSRNYAPPDRAQPAWPRGRLLACHPPRRSTSRR